MVQLNSNSPINLRLKFRKVGALQYISHLDLLRTLNKAIIRAKLPVWYTEGFNPKPKIVFAAPLSIGTESVTEFVDVRLSEYVSETDALKRINENVTEEMRVAEAYYPASRLNELGWFSYTVRIRTNGASAVLAAQCEKYLLSERVEIEKRTKNGGTAVSDIRRLIRSASAVLDGEEIKLSCVLSAEPSAFLNPENVVKALKGKFGILSGEDLTAEYYSIMRENAYFSDMREFK